MPIVFQAKGKKHCENIRQSAWEMWRIAPAAINRDFVYYLKQAIEDHRMLVEDEMRMKKEEQEAHECL